MKKLLLIALLMLTVVFAAVACTEPTEPVDTTAAETDAETTAAADAETTAATGDETTAEAGDETTAATGDETTAEAGDETTAEETTAEETTAEETVDFDTYESDIMVWKPAGAMYHVYDILGTGDDMADYFELDYVTATGFGQGLGIGAYYHQDAPFGDFAWYVIQNSSAAMFKEMEKAYVYTVDMMLNDGDGALDNSGIFVRGSEDLYTGSWAGKTGDNQGFGGSGIYFNIEYIADNGIYFPTYLVITLKSDVQGEGGEMTFTETNIEIEVEDDCITIADDGETVSVVVGDELVATIAISGTKAYADYDIEEGVIASTATVTLADGTTQTIENVACAAGFGTLGIGSCTDDVDGDGSAGQFTFSSVKVNALSTYDVPEFAD